MAYVVRKNFASDQADGTSIVFGTCPFLHQEYKVVVETAALLRFMQGEHAQNCFPEMDRGNREFLISGISPEGWQKMFGNLDYI
jgi:hypothetical protein